MAQVCSPKIGFGSPPVMSGPLAMKGQTASNSVNPFATAFNSVAVHKTPSPVETGGSLASKGSPTETSGAMACLFGSFGGSSDSGPGKIG